jgi:excisionase family DNA binding protein
VELLTVSEVAKRLRLHEMTVRRHIKSGRLRAVRVGRRIRILDQDVERILEPEPAKENGPRRREGPGVSPGGQHEMTPEELRAWVTRKRTPEELRRMQKAFAEMKRIRDMSKPLGMSTATLVRVSRRMNEVAYGEKTWEELIAEES